jgi:hypothetical protein
MVSMAHEVLVDLFKNRPSLAAEILSEVLGVEMPVYAQARLASIDLTEVQPAEYRADVVVVLLLEGDVPVRVIVVEVQLDKKERKRFTWPAYLAVARAVHECPADLLVVAPDAGVAAWCAEPIEIGAPGFVLRPQVLRRVDVPVVERPEEAARRPELGVLSAMAHGDTEKGAAIASAVLPVLGGLDDDRGRFYYDLVCNSLNEAARKALDEKMKGYEYQSDFAKKYVAQGRAERWLDRGGDFSCCWCCAGAGSPCRTPNASASWRRKTWNAWSGGCERSSPLPSPRCSQSRADPGWMR